MNYPPPQPQLPNDDEMVRAMKRANRMPLLIGLGVVAALVLGSALWVAKSFVAARADLEHEGYTDPKVTFHGPFSFGFTGTKGTATCSGTMTRYPGSSSVQEMCLDTTPPAPTVVKPPPLTNREQIEASMKKNYADDGFTKFTCPEIADADTTAKCTLAGDNGATVTVSVERTKVDTDGTWGSWTTTLAETVRSGEALSAQLTKSVGAAAKTSHHKNLTVDCGTGPVVFTGGHLTCKLTTEDAKPVHATVELTTKKEGGYNWTVKGL